MDNGKATLEGKVRAFMVDFQARDLVRLKEWFRDDSEVWVPPAAPVRTRRRIAALFRAIFSRYGTMRWTIDRIYTVDDRTVIYEHSSEGTLGEDTPYSNRVLTILEFDAEGKIERLSDFFKDTRAFS